MTIRDSFASINNDKTVYEMPSGGLQIVSEDGRTLFGITLNGNVLELESGDHCNHGGVILENRFVIAPVAANRVNIIKPEIIDRETGLSELIEALKELAECSPCRNGCAKDDMTCASNKARAVLAKHAGRKSA